MARIHDDREVCLFVKDRDALQIERVSCIGFKCTDASLAEDDILVAGRHNVLRGHDPLLVGSVQTAL